MADASLPLADLPNIEPDPLRPIEASAGPGAPAHPPRILILYGSLREPVLLAPLVPTRTARVERAEASRGA